MRATTGRAGLRVASALWIVAGAWYLVTEAVVAESFSGYGYSSDYISDLGQPLRSPLAAWMNAAFIAQGVAFALASALVAAAVRPGPGIVAFLGLALIYGAGSATVGFVPSGGTGTPALVHVGGATAAIVAGNLAVTTAGGVLLRRRRLRAVGITSVVLGVAGLIFGGLLLCSSALGAPVFVGDGAWERGAIYTIIGWQLLAAVTVLLSAAPRVDAARPRTQPARPTDSGPDPTARP